MLQKTVYKSRAIMAGICIAAALFVVSVFPLRLWRTTVPVSGNGRPLVQSEKVDTTGTVSQVFTAGYDRLRYLDVFLASLDGGRYLDAELRSSEDEVLFHRTIDLAETQVPGFVRIKAGVELKVGLQYRLYLRGRLSSFRVGLEPVADNPVPERGAYFTAYDPHPSLRLHMVTGYDVPLGKGISLLMMAAAILVAALLVLPVRKWFLQNPEKDRLLLLSAIVEKVLYTVTGAFFLALFVFNFPMKKFHDSPGEILFLGTGIVFAALITFYAIRRFCTEPKRDDRMPLKGRVASVFFALAFAYACEYMNGESNLMHSASERQMMVCLLVVVLLSFRTDMLVNRLNVVWGILSGAGAAWYVFRYALHAQTMQEKYQNTVLRCNALLIMLGGIVLISAARSVRARVWKRPRLAPFGMLTLLTLAGLIASSSNRITEISLLVLCAVFYICISCNVPTARFIRVLTRGVYINFLLTMGYCLLFRAYQGFIFARYGMVFPTVAITGEYLASVTLFSAAGLLLRLAKDSDDTSWRIKIRHAWREIYVFAFAGVYAVLTLSRTAYLTIVTGVVLLLLTVCTAFMLRHKGVPHMSFPGRFLFVTCIMVFSCVLFFPGLFSMQRILPAMVGRHRVITRLEETNMIHDILGDAEWDCSYYISGIRFWSLFRARLLRMPELLYIRAEDRYNYDEFFRPLYTETGEPVTWEEEDESVTPQPSAFSEVQEGTGENTVDVSNGRLDIFRTYLSRLSIKGHGVLFTENPDYIHAHNSYLQVLYTNGIPAGLLFTGWITCAATLPLVRYIKHVRFRKEEDVTGDEYLFTAAGTVAFAIAALTEFNFQLCNPMCMLMLTGIVSLVFKKEEAAC